MERQQGTVEKAGPAAAIPKTFHFIWLGGEPPEEYLQYMHRWLSLHSDWKIMQWDDSDGVAMYNQELWDRAPEIVPTHVEQFRSDLMRYEALLKFGGVYVDFDMQPQRNIESLLTGQTAMLGWEEEDVWANNALMAATPRHPFLIDLVHGLVPHVHVCKGRGWRPNKLSGPQYLTPVLHRHAGTVHVYPQGYFYPYAWNELHRRGEVFPEAYCIHHWNNQRRRLAAA